MLQLLPICEEESENSTRYNCLNYLTIPWVVLDPNMHYNSLHQEGIVGRLTESHK